MKKNKTQDSLLWKINPKGGGQASYLFGTMHVRDLRAFGWLDLAMQYVAECEVFATEFDFSETDSEALSVALELPEGKDLQEWLSPQAWRNLDRYARKKFGSDAETFRHQHPMTVSTALSMAFLLEESAHSLDETLWQHARSLGKSTTGVETFADQLETLRQIPFEMHLKSLTWLLKNYGRHKTRLHKMMQRYADGEIQALYQSAKKDAKGMRKILLYHRNELMARRFAEIAVGQPLFCAVGAGHLAGGKGMLRLLKKAGFTIKPILSGK
ncbi:MAG: TraB/GumN family protein [Phycisphaerae bacterium]|nr:TraB/GumN family protein [Saprospiraceae bacterium]